MSVHVQAIKALTPADYLIIEKEHRLLEKFLADLRDACVCSRQEQLPDCNRCDYEKQTSCQGRLPSFLYYVIDLAADHFDHEEAIMLRRPHVTEDYEYYRMHKLAHAEIMHKLNALVEECFALDREANTAEIYIRFYEKLSNIFEEHDRSFDDPFILSTKVG
jgi:hemerythrin